MDEGVIPKYRLLLKYPTRGRPKQFDETRAIYLGMLDFMWLQCLGMILVIIFPQIALWLPGVLFG